MVFGCECGDGWYQILDELLGKLSQYEFLYLAQVKEKFATLRVYVDMDTQSGKIPAAVDKYIDEANKKSTKICETCGQPGEIRKGAWLKTLCDKCYDSTRFPHK